MILKKSHSIIFVTGTILSIVLSISLLSMMATVVAIKDAEGDAEKINIAGSLRMYSMRIALAYQTNAIEQIHKEKTSQMLTKEIDDFESRLYSTLFIDDADTNSESQVSRQLVDIKELWKTIKRSLIPQSAPPEVITGEMHQLVTMIDQFVTLSQRRTESKLNHLRLLHSSGILFTLLVAVIAMWLLVTRIIKPLSELVVGAQEAQSGNFQHRVKLKSTDELGMLANAYNKMTESLGILYNDLETQVRKKTTALQMRNEALQFLNHTARALAETPNSKHTYLQLVDECRQITQLNSVKLTVYGINNTDIKVFEYESILPVDTHSARQTTNVDTTYTTEVELEHSHKPIGMLSVTSTKPELATWQQQLLDTFADIISKAFGNLISLEREHRLLLVEERATIARELHDSIAQTLSFLKMQMARFATLIKKQAEQEVLQQVADELKEGISIAYQQLREVLTTFRLQSHEPGLQQALKSAISEYSQRGNLEIKMHYALENISPTANEEIHILQIIREALNNVIKHAQASEVNIFITNINDHKTEIIIEDNGIGITNTEKPFSHGLTIMKERATQLSGSCQIGNSAKGGAKVHVVCQLNQDQQSGDLINPFTDGSDTGV